MKKLNLPEYDFTIVKEDKKTKIFDGIRRKYLLLTPEEWVRQHIVRFLVEEKKFPKGLIALEKGLKMNGLNKRSDILVYSQKGNPIFMVECKATSVKINQSVFDQISRYNISYQLPYLLVTNGLQHYCAKINFNEKKFNFLNDIPFYHELED